jgi:hypothetical protein
MLLALALTAACSGNRTTTPGDGGPGDTIGSSGSSGSSGGSSGAGSASGAGAGSGSGGNPSCDVGSSACDACTAESCCAQEQACAEDEACAILLKCLLACGSDQTCVSACGSAVPTSSLDELVSALNCSAANCTAACSTAADAGTTCGSIPTLHEGTAGSIYCDSQLTCSGHEQCCLGGALGGGQYAADSCVALGGSCSNGGQPSAGGSPGIPIECEQVSDCRTNGATSAVSCCLQSATTPADPPGCSYPRATLGSSVVCETTACADGEATVCSSQADCPAGKTCTPGKWKTLQIGFCL